jgi:hypothetical protein
MNVPGGNTVFRVTVPENVLPGEEFQVYAGNRIVRVRCPPDSRPGQSLQITVPVDPSTPSENNNDPNDDPNLPPDSPNVRKIPNTNPAAYMVTIPSGVRENQQFPVTIAGQQLMVTCPPNARVGMQVRIVPPPPPTDITRGPEGPMGAPHRKPEKKKDEETQLFEVEVPRGVQPGQVRDLQEVQEPDVNEA